MTSDDIKKVIDQALSACRSTDNESGLEEIRIKYLGRKGMLPEIMKGLKDLPSEDRATAGQLANKLKTSLSEAISQKKSDLTSGGAPSAGKKGKSSSTIDLSLPGQWRQMGTKHPLSIVTDEIVQIFRNLGFTVADGPDIEDKYHNFDALNTPEHHPASDPLDTFWFESGDLLRTQTSPVQIRVMEKSKPPIRIITPGRCYRRDTTDATHSANFHQLEGLYVDTGVSLADLKGVLAHFAHEIMGPDVNVRFRPHFFPFTEPSVECDFSCHVCGGKGCRVCKNSGWIEILGAGMVDPRVFEGVGYDTSEITGYAFGLGLERVTMIKYGITDIRMLYDNDLRFLEQFK